MQTQYGKCLDGQTKIYNFLIFSATMTAGEPSVINRRSPHCTMPTTEVKNEEVAEHEDEHAMEANADDPPVPDAGDASPTPKDESEPTGVTAKQISPKIAGVGGHSCKCIKSKCLKLYCDCFRHNEVCGTSCECCDCKNSEAESGPDGIRTQTMLQVIKTRPDVFDGLLSDGDERRQLFVAMAASNKPGGGRGRGRPRTKTTGKILPIKSSKTAGKRSRGKSAVENIPTAVEAATSLDQDGESTKKKVRSSPRLSSETKAKDDDVQVSGVFLEEPPSTVGLPFTIEEYPDLEMDETEDHGNLVHAFKEPLFPKDPSPVLAIAYSHHAAAVEQRKRMRQKKKDALKELQRLRQEFYRQKQKLLDVNAALKRSSQNVGRWTRKVFDLELQEPCPWNDKLRKLREYVHAHGVAPEHIKKTKGSDEEKTLATFVAGMKNKVKSNHKSVLKYPHRKQALEELGVHWENENEARFETMFRKLLEYKKEHGTLRMPSLDLCKESGDADLVALHNWVFSQVGSVRYQLKTKKVETVKRFLDIGFSFERWYGTNGHVFERDIEKFDEIAKFYVESGGRLPDEVKEDEQSRDCEGKGEKPDAGKGRETGTTAEGEAEMGKRTIKAEAHAEGGGGAGSGDDEASQRDGNDVERHGVYEAIKEEGGGKREAGDEGAREKQEEVGVKSDAHLGEGGMVNKKTKNGGDGEKAAAGLQNESVLV